MIRDLWRYSSTLERWIFGAIVLAVPLMIWAAIEEERRWDRFKVEHQCKVISRESPTTSYGSSSSGNVVTMITPGKTGWLCNDGVTYWR